VKASDAEFAEFAGASALRLRRTAFLLCHDWHNAEDLTQTALAKTYVSWRRVWNTGNPEAYTRKILLRSFLDQQRAAVRPSWCCPSCRRPAVRNTASCG